VSGFGHPPSDELRLSEDASPYRRVAFPIHRFGR